MSDKCNVTKDRLDVQPGSKPVKNSQSTEADAVQGRRSKENRSFPRKKTKNTMS